MEKHLLVEQSIAKKYRRQIWLPFLNAVRDYQLISPGDSIAVCISGGKDSTLLAKCMQHLHKYSNFPFTVQYLVMDPGYSGVNRQVIEENVRLLDLPAVFFETDIFNIVAKSERSPCYLCAKMRRGYLYKKAKELGCNKIALGHHFDDVIETVLMSMFYGAEIRTMMPKLTSSHFEGMELIRPLYRVHEADILAWKRYNSLNFIQCACRLTENCVLGDGSGCSKRQEMKTLIRQMRQNSPEIGQNIFTAIHNVNLDAIVGFRKDGVRHSFLEEYSPPGGKPDGK